MSAVRAYDVSDLCPPRVHYISIPCLLHVYDTSVLGLLYILYPPCIYYVPMMYLLCLPRIYYVSTLRLLCAYDVSALCLPCIYYISILHLLLCIYDGVNLYLFISI